MRYEKPEIVGVDDAAKSIQQVAKDRSPIDHSNATNLPPSYPSDE
jgi:hypothetical protein